MEAANAARLMTARTGDVVQSAFEAGYRANVLQRRAVFRCFLQRTDNVIFAKYGMSGCALTLHQTELRLEVRRIKSDRRRRDCAGRQKSVRYQNRAAIELAQMFRLEQPCGEVAPEIVVGQNPIAIELVFQRRFLEDAGLRVVAKHLQQIISTEIANRRFRRMRDLEIGFDPVDIYRLDKFERSVPGHQSDREVSTGLRPFGGGEPALGDIL